MLFWINIVRACSGHSAARRWAIAEKGHVRRIEVNRLRVFDDSIFVIPRCEESVTLLFGGLSIHFSVTSRLGMPSDAERNEVFRRLPDVGSFLHDSEAFSDAMKNKIVGSFLQKK